MAHIYLDGCAENMNPNRIITTIPSADTILTLSPAVSIRRNMKRMARREE